MFPNASRVCRVRLKGVAANTMAVCATTLQVAGTFGSTSTMGSMAVTGAALDQVGTRKPLSVTTTSSTAAITGRTTTEYWPLPWSSTALLFFTHRDGLVVMKDEYGVKSL